MLCKKKKEYRKNSMEVIFLYQKGSFVIFWHLEKVLQSGSHPFDPFGKHQKLVTLLTLLGSALGICSVDFCLVTLSCSMELLDSDLLLSSPGSLALCQLLVMLPADCFSDSTTFLYWLLEFSYSHFYLQKLWIS